MQIDSNGENSTLLIKIICKFIAERSLFTPHIAVELNILLIILGNVYLIKLDVFLVFNDDFFVAFFKKLKIFHNVLEMKESHLGDFTILV